MSPQEKNKLRDLCREAMSETDVQKLLFIFLELDRAASQVHLREMLFDEGAGDTDRCA